MSTEHDHPTPPQGPTPNARRWGLFPQAGSASAESGLQPSTDPRTTPVATGLEIHILEGEDAGKTFSLDTWEIVLGRRMTPDEKKTGWLLFNEPTVSRMHAVLEWRPGPRRYRVDHQSRTNPTLVNGRQVQQAILYPDDMIRIGDLTFQLRVRSNKAQDENSHPQVPDKGRIYSGFKISVVKGPDAGKQLALEHKVLHIGGPSARTEATGENWIVIDDPALPKEQAFLVWYEAEKRYGVFHAGTSSVPTQISRVLNPANPAAHNEARNLLNIDDGVILGETVIMFLKHERFLETGRAFLNVGGESPVRPRALPPSSASQADDPGAQAAGGTSTTEPPTTSPSTPPAPAAAQAPPGPISPRAALGGSEIALRGADALQAARKIQVLNPTEVASPRHDDSSEAPAVSDRIFEQTSAWFVQPDYVLEFLQGPEMGRRVTLKASAFRDDKPLTIGSRGRRNNALELSGNGIDNQVAQIHYRGGRFYLARDAQGSTEVSTNDIPLEPEELRMLKNGDELTLGPNTVLFIDRQALERQYQFELELTRENGIACTDRTTVLNQQALTIGRSQQCDIRIDDPNVSRVHAQISFGRGSFVLTHKSGTNPTFVNGVSLEEGQQRLLESGDEIQLSDDSCMVFRRRRALELS